MAQLPQIDYSIPLQEQLRWCDLAMSHADARTAEILRFSREYHDIILAQARYMQGSYIGLISLQILFVRAALDMWNRKCAGDPKWYEPSLPHTS